MSKVSHNILSEIFENRFYEEYLGSEIILNNKKYLMFGAVNYLGLSHHAAIIKASIDAINRYGAGGLGSRASNGCLDIHQKLDKSIANFMGKESALVFNSGYMANLGVISSISDKNTVLFSDKENHLSIYDGCILSRCKVFRYRHNDMNNLMDLLGKTDKNQIKWIIIVGTFGATGELVKLKQIVSLAKEYQAKIYLDDAHSIGIFGKNLRGLSEKEEVIDKIDLIMGSFQMAFGNIGAFVCGNKFLIDKLKFNSRQYIFSYNLPASNVSAITKAIEILKSTEGKELVKKLFNNVEYMKTRLISANLSIIPSTSQIISIKIGNDDKCINFFKSIFNDGLWAQIYLHPSVPINNAIVRLTPSALHTKEQCEKAITILVKNAKKHGII